MLPLFGFQSAGHFVLTTRISHVILREMPYVGDIAHVLHRPADRFGGTNDQIGGQESSEVADMSIGVDRRPARIETKATRLDKLERLELTRHRIVEAKRSFGHSMSLPTQFGVKPDRMDQWQLQKAINWGKFMNESVSLDAKKRLARIAGQVAGIQKMVDEERYCVDILTQVSALRAALDQFGLLMLTTHLENCVYGHDQSGDENCQHMTSEERLAEIKVTLNRFLK